ncbi:MAG: hypothetical protein OXH50_15460 [Gemmatimonadetes bacterium]|nr:hypothetical protein [Gemmatimonadota bacterium]
MADPTTIELGNLKVEVEKDSSGHYVAHSPDVAANVGGVPVRPTVGVKVERTPDGSEEVSVKIGVRIPTD